jgi:lauroyl/myristoyl acyltransferase
VLPDEARLRLFPHLIYRISGEDCMVFRVGCSKITTIATSKLGAETIRILRSGKTIGQTKEILRTRLGLAEGQLDLSPVLDAMAKAKLVRTVDQQVVDAERPAARRVMLHRLQLSVQVSRTWAREAAIRYLPPNTAHRILCFAKLWRRRARLSPLPSALRENLQRALGDRFSQPAIESIRIEHHREQVRRAIDVQILRNLPRAKMARWLQNSVQFSGLERLRSAQAEGRGAIICGFHFGAPQLLVPLLWRHGISFVGAAAIPPFRGKNLAEKLILDNSYLKQGVPGCGTVTWYTRFSFRGFLEMMKAVERGETVLMFPDGYFNRPNREIARYFGHLAAEYRPAQTAVPFLGQLIAANLMVPWLWLQTRAPLIPVKLLRRGGARFEVVVAPPLNLAAGETIQDAAVKLYSVLERDIYLHPASWNYWGRLHEFTPTATKPLEELITEHLAPVPAN